MHGASTGHPHSRKMNSFASTVLRNMAGGIWESMTKNPRTPRDTTNSPTGTLKMFTAVAYSRQKAAPANTITMTSRPRRRTCTECWTPRRLRQLRSAHVQLHLAERPAGRDIRYDDPILRSAVHDPED